MGTSGGRYLAITATVTTFTVGDQNAAIEEIFDSNFGNVVKDIYGEEFGGTMTASAWELTLRDGHRFWLRKARMPTPMPASGLNCFWSQVLPAFGQLI